MKAKIIKIITIISILIILIVTGFVAFSGCSYNQSMFDVDYGFTKALVNENGQWVEYQVSKWDDYENDMICIWTEDGKVIYTSSVNIVLYGED